LRAEHHAALRNESKIDIFERDFSRALKTTQGSEEEAKVK
jgi:hypothetical protein